MPELFAAARRSATDTLDDGAGLGDGCEGLGAGRLFDGLEEGRGDGREGLGLGEGEGLDALYSFILCPAFLAAARLSATLPIFIAQSYFHYILIVTSPFLVGLP